ncbi:MAG: hypothetical protein K6E83_06920 [Clostridium sp.]|nr:hypothetical protein [Clostridium sp.]
MSLRKKVTAAAFGTLLGMSVLTGSVYAAPAENAAQTESVQKEKPEHKGFLESLVESGKLSESTCENIRTYMKEHRPEKKEHASDGSGTTERTKPSKKTDSTGEERTAKAKPEKKNDASDTDAVSSATEASGQKKHGRGGHRGGRINEEMLTELLGAGVITQSEYDVIKEALPEKPAEKQ